VTLSRRKVLYIAGIAALVLVVAFNWSQRRRDYRSVVSTEAQLDAAGVSPGVKVSRVLAVLDSLGAIHSPLNADRTIGARIGRSFENGMIHGDIHATFRFDTTQRLVARSIREVLTGP
jgi:hypothetical protein